MNDRNGNRLSRALAEFVLDEMSRRKMSQTQLARITGYSVSSINNALNDRTIVSTNTWTAMLDALDIEVGFRVKPDRADRALSHQGLPCQPPTAYGSAEHATTNGSNTDE